MTDDAGSIPAIVANVATLSSGVVAYLATDVAKCARYSVGMLGEWVERAIASAEGMNQVILAQRLRAELDRSFDKNMVSRIIHGKRTLYADEMLVISKITGFPLPIAGAMTSDTLWVELKRLDPRVLRGLRTALVASYTVATRKRDMSPEAFASSVMLTLGALQLSSVDQPDFQFQSLAESAASVSAESERLAQE